jgi:hypothetical protein
MRVSDILGRFVRTLLQLAAGGGLTIFVDQVVKDIPDKYDWYVIFGATLVANAAQNVCEEMGWIPKLFKPESPPAPSTVPIAQAPE